MNINEYIKSVETLKNVRPIESIFVYVYNNNSFFKANCYFAKTHNIIIRTFSRLFQCFLTNVFSLFSYSKFAKIREITLRRYSRFDRLYAYKRVLTIPYR